MGTRRRDAERRQVSLAVEALEDRFLLSAALSSSFPVSASASEARDTSLQGILGHASLWQTTGAPINPIIDYLHDPDGDHDLPDAMDRGKPDNSLVVYPLFCSTGNHVEGCLYLTPPTRTAEQMVLPAANPSAFLPLVSASGLGAMSVAPIPTAASSMPDTESTPGNLAPSPDMEQTLPRPVYPSRPQSLPPPQADDAADQPSTSSGLPLIDLLPIDVDAIQRGVNSFFQQLSDLSEEWCKGQLLEKLAPWLLAASVAGYGWIRFRDREDQRFIDLLCDRPETVPTNFLPGGEG